MRTVFTLAACAAALAGCSIHPIPDDVTRDSTVSIVQAIRCETRSAIRPQLADILSQSTSPRTRQIADELASGRRDLHQIYRRDIDPASLREMKRFYDVGIGYNFDLTMEENNDGTADTLFTLPFTNGTFTLGVSGGKERMRQNKRTFLIIDTVKELAESEFCLDKPARDANWVYPISGRIGMEEFVRTFYELITSTGKLEATENHVALADQLTFKTKFFGAVNPRIVLAPVTNHFKLTEASVNLSADRIDTHQVIVAIRLPDKFQREAQLKRSIAEDIENLRELDAFRRSDF